MYKIDLHTHSTASPDGGITLSQYKMALNNGVVDFVAITDHNQVDFALAAKHKLGNAIIVGEEITTTDGEIVGLFLNKLVPEGLTVAETIKQIKKQGGLVYIPHPFETVRKGISQATLKKIAKDVDIIECFNGRALFQNKSSLAIKASETYNLAPCSSSDAHGYYGLGSHTAIAKKPTVKNLLAQLSAGKTSKKRPSIRAVLYPKYNVVRKFKGKHS